MQYNDQVPCEVPYDEKVHSISSINKFLVHFFFTETELSCSDEKFSFTWRPFINSQKQVGSSTVSKKALQFILEVVSLLKHHQANTQMKPGRFLELNRMSSFFLQYSINMSL